MRVARERRQANGLVRRATRARMYRRRDSRSRTRLIRCGSGSPGETGFASQSAQTCPIAPTRLRIAHGVGDGPAAPPGTNTSGEESPWTAERGVDVTGLVERA